MIAITCDECGKNIQYSIKWGEIEGEEPQAFFQRPSAIVVGSMIFEHYSPSVLYYSSVGDHFIACSVGCSEQAIKSGKVNMEYSDVVLFLQGNRMKAQYNRAVRQAQVNLHNLNTSASDVIKKQKESDEAKWTV